MLIQIRHALLEVTSPPATKQSAIVINSEFIITSGSILEPHLRLVGDKGDENKGIVARLEQGQLIDVQAEEGNRFRSLYFVVTFDPHQDRPRPRQNVILTRYSAYPLYVFSAAEVSRNLHIIMQVSDGKSKIEVLRSSFVVLGMSPPSKEKSFKSFLSQFSKYLRHLQPVQTLDDVLVLCSPFGMENFYKTVSIGKVSNVMGRMGCLFSISNALPLGCEGSAVFNSKLRLTGIIICTSFRRQNENVNLTMAANFGYLLRNFMEQLGMPNRIIQLPRQPSSFPWERTIVVINTPDQQGTGTFIRVHHRHFILTCAHVVGQGTKRVNCRASDREFQSHVIWCNPDSERPFDLALLTAPADVPERYYVRLAKNPAALGQTVYNAGFPYPVNFGCKHDFNPAIFQGRIIKCDAGAIMSDGSVQAGQSGGPMFDEYGSILGVCVSNVKVLGTRTLIQRYPFVIYATRCISLPEPTSRIDVRELDNLVASDAVDRVWALECPPTQSKL